MDVAPDSAESDYRQRESVSRAVLVTAHLINAESRSRRCRSREPVLEASRLSDAHLFDKCRQLAGVVVHVNVPLVGRGEGEIAYGQCGECSNRNRSSTGRVLRG